MSQSEFSLMHDFPQPQRDAWDAAVEKTLKGAPADKVLSRTLASGIKASSFISVDERGTQSVVPGMRRGAWVTGVRLAVMDSKTANTVSLEDLEGGASSLFLSGEIDAGTLLDGVLLDLAGVRLETGATSDDSRKGLMTVFEASDTDVAASCLGFDPIGASAIGTPGGLSVAEVLTESSTLRAKQPNVALFVVDGRRYHDQGATSVQELAYTLAQAVAYFRACEDEGLAPEDAAARFEIWVAADSDVLGTLSKLRALRLLWSQLCAHTSCSPSVTRIVAVASDRMMAKVDEPVNMLRLTSACFAAGLGGADAVLLSPHDSLSGAASKTARRVARNIQTILMEESGLDRVMDPARGSEQIEAMTDDLAKSAWSLFQTVETAGGLLAYAGSGELKQSLDESWSDRVKLLRNRRIGMTGVSEFPNLQEEWADQSMRSAAPSGAVRDAGVFEDYRSMSEETLRKTGTRPYVTAITLGTEAEHSARLTFVSSLLASIGVETVPVPETEFTEASSSAIAVMLCGSDTQYAASGETLAASVQARSEVPLWIAGKPENYEAIAASGVSRALVFGMDCIALAEDIYGAGDAS